MDTIARPVGSAIAPLGLGGVLAGSLPTTLLTDHAPERYTVEAVFTRRPEREEIAEIVAPDTQTHLAERGYPGVRLAVSDRRIEIAGTTLEELRDGLGSVIADLLVGISAQVRGGREVAAARFREITAREQDRAAAIAALAESVGFVAAVELADATA